MKKVAFTLILAALSTFAFAQEQAIYSQYQFFPILVNPGHTGFNDQHEFVLNARSSWTGFPGQPKTFTAMYSGPVTDKLALGGGIFSDKAGDVSTLRLQLNYAFRFQIQKARIGLGLSTEFLNRRVDPDLLGHYLVDVNDEVLENMADNQRIFDASVGAHMLYDERFFVSLALPNTIRTQLDEVALAGDETPSDRGLFKHYIFQLGYIIDVPSQNFKLVPSMVLRQVRDVPYQIDINVQGRFLEDKLIAGLTFRPSTGGSMAFTLGSRYNKFQIYYSYDISFTKFQQYNGGSHEISLAYAIDRKSKATPTPIDPNQ